jgi:hypothetical protein
MASDAASNPGHVDAYEGPPLRKPAPAAGPHGETDDELSTHRAAMEALRKAA